MTTAVIDIEADDLLLKASRIWCVAIKELETQREFLYLEEDQHKCSIHIAQLDVVIGHNILGYDLLVLHKLWGIPFTVGPDTLFGRRIQLIDTLVYSRVLNPDRIEGHSLEAWGKKLSMYKGDHTDFSKYTPEMGEYCLQDVRVTEKVYEALLREMNET